jgi:hypothetical protein
MLCVGFLLNFHLLIKMEKYPKLEIFRLGGLGQLELWSSYTLVSRLTPLMQLAFGP